jgi:ACS family tartrate transporter-like MFS transporter
MIDDAGNRDRLREGPAVNHFRHPVDIPLEETVWKKLTWRLIPFMCLLYFTAFLDRVNLSFVAAQLKADLGFSKQIYGFGAGAFFIGYFLFEVPSNLVLERVGARVWIARIMIMWGIISSCMMFVKTSLMFYLVRFLLGAAEAGFAPGMVLYLTYWFPAAHRSRTIALFLTAAAMSGVVGAPLTGVLLKGLDGLGGLRGWQWIFLLEGLPAVLLGGVVLFYLPSRPEEARWLSVEEVALIRSRLELECSQKERQGRYTLVQALLSGKVLLLSIIYFMLLLAGYGIDLWLPQIIRNSFQSGDRTTGFLTAIPYLVAAVGMVLIGRHSDRRGERRWHFALTALTGTLGMVLGALSRNPLWVIVGLSLGELARWGIMGPFWALPSSFLTGTAAAGGLALINSLGHLGAFVGPSLIGLVVKQDNDYSVGLVLLGLSFLVSSVLVLAVRIKPDRGTLTN